MLFSQGYGNSDMVLCLNLDGFASEWAAGGVQLVKAAKLGHLTSQLRMAAAFWYYQRRRLQCYSNCTSKLDRVKDRLFI